MRRMRTRECEKDVSKHTHTYIEPNESTNQMIDGGRFADPAKRHLTVELAHTNTQDVR